MPGRVRPARYVFLVLVFLLAAVSPAFPAFAAEPADAIPANGDRERGRTIFNGIGGCSYCHGHDGDIARRPPLSPQLAEALAHLNPTPSDLRNPAGLKSETEVQRFLSIKFGHRGTAMFSKRFLSDEEIGHLLAYLAVLRADATGTP